MGCGFMAFMNEISPVAPTCCAVLYLYKQTRYRLYMQARYAQAQQSCDDFSNYNMKTHQRRRETGKGEGKLDKMRKQLSSCNYNSIKLCPLTYQLSTIICQLAWRAVSNETIGTISHSPDKAVSIAAAIDQLFGRASIAIGCNFRCSYVANPTMT